MDAFMHLERNDKCVDEYRCIIKLYELAPMFMEALGIKYDLDQINPTMKL